jgi:hypothetical protein
MVNAARTAGVTDPILYIFIPRKSRDELLTAIASELAAEQTLNAKGVPATSEGQVARQSMESRLRLAQEQRRALVTDIVGAAKVFQGGGNELLQLTLDEKIRAGAEASLVRLFPRFKEADFAGSAWESAIKRARDGADQPFSPLKYQGAIDQHPVCRQVLTTIGSGKAGTPIRKDLEGSPCGWPRDAVDAALIALHRGQHINGILNGVAVPAGQLDQNKIAKTEFRVEKITLTVQERNAIKALYLDLDIKAKSEELDAKAPEFFTKLLTLAAEAGGEAPRPPLPSVTDIEDIQKLVGNDRLAQLRDKAPDLRKRIAEWKKTRELIGKRLPAWNTLERLAGHAAALPGAASGRTQVDAIRTKRLLLDDPDRVAPLRATLAGLLRQALNGAQEATEKAYCEALKYLQGNATWQKVAAADQSRILADVGLQPPAKPDVSDDEALLAALDSKDLEARNTEAEAIPARAARALQIAARLLEPKVQFVTLDHAVVRSESEIDAWWGRQRQRLIGALAQGPVQIQ